MSQKVQMFPLYKNRAVWWQFQQPSATLLLLFTFMHWRRKWQPTTVFLLGESQGRGSLVGCCLWGRTEQDTTEATQQQQPQWSAYLPVHGAGKIHSCTTGFIALALLGLLIYYHDFRKIIKNVCPEETCLNWMVRNHGLGQHKNLSLLDSFASKSTPPLGNPQLCVDLVEDSGRPRSEISKSCIFPFSILVHQGSVR